MKNGLGNDSGKTGPGAIRVHQPPSSSAWLLRSQNSSATPVVSWNQVGKPPMDGALLTGPMRSSTAWAGAAAARARTTAAEITDRFGVFMSIPEKGCVRSRALPDYAAHVLSRWSCWSGRLRDTVGLAVPGT